MAISFYIIMNVISSIMNRVESFWGFYENETLVWIMYEDFIKGTKEGSKKSHF